jgi:hypothetical protein
MQNKFKEFWITPSMDAFEFERKYFSDEDVHVVEYAALESANAEIERMRNELRDKLVGNFFQSENKKLTDAVSEINTALLDCHNENAKLRAALEFYSKDINWTEGMNYWEDFQITPCGNDLGAIAREALEKLK